MSAGEWECLKMKTKTETETGMLLVGLNRGCAGEQLIV